MKRRKVLLTLAGLGPVIHLLTGLALALEETEVEEAVTAAGKEGVAGNLLIWFLCAIGFLKVSQKMDSFMSALGINVGRTGSSMLGELMIAGRAAAGAMGHAAGHIFRGAQSAGHGGARTAGAGTPANDQVGHGAIGMAKEAAGNAAVSAVTGQNTGLAGKAGEKLFQSSLRQGGQFSTNVIRSVATGSIARMGMMTGPQAAEALTGYLGLVREEADGEEPYSPGGDGLFPEKQEQSVTGTTRGGGELPQSQDGPVPRAPDRENGFSGGDVVTLNGGAAGASAAQMVMDMERSPAVPAAPVFSSVEIGGGRISGVETPAGGGESRQFTMYNAAQYLEPTGKFETVNTVDGEQWYRQYAQPAVEKTPKEVTEKGVQYEQKLVMRMPPVPRRKDKI